MFRLKTEAKLELLFALTPALSPCGEGERCLPRVVMLSVRLQSPSLRIQSQCGINVRRRCEATLTLSAKAGEG